jgi:YVTN family beta-propeller protein
VTKTYDDIGARPWGIGISADGKLLYTANGSSGDVSVVDAETGKVIRKIATGGGPWGISVPR